MGTIRKRLGCMLLTLVMCLGLLPGTAWAGTSYTYSGDLKINLSWSSATNGEQNGNLDKDGYTWMKVSDSECTLTLKDIKIDGNLVLPSKSTLAKDPIKATITLQGTNEITGTLNGGAIGSYSGSIILKIKGSGTLTANGISGDGNNKSELILSGGAKVTTTSLSMGASGGADGDVTVKEKSTLILTTDSFLVTHLTVSDGSKVIAQEGMKITVSNDGSNPPSIKITDDESYVELGKDRGTAAALWTDENAATGNNTKLYAVLAQLGKANCLPAELYDYENSQGKYSLVSFSGLSTGLSTGYYLCQTNNDGTPTLWTHLILKKNSASADDSSGSDDSDDSGSGSGSHRTHWYDIICNQPEHGSIEAPEKGYKNLGVEMTLTVDEGYILDKILVTNRDETETFKVRQLADGTYQFTMPAKDVLVTPILKEAPYILLTIDSCDAWVFTKMVTNDVAPVIRNARTMLPARFVIEALGGVVLWNQEAQEVTIFKDGSVMVIRIGAGYALIDGEVIALDSPAFIENDRTYLPIRFIAENMGAKVAWDAEKQTVKIVPER